MAGRVRTGSQGALSTPRTTLSDCGDTLSLSGSALLRCRLRIDMWKIPGDIAATRVWKTTGLSGLIAVSRSASKSHSGIQTLLDMYVVTCCWSEEVPRCRI